MHTDRGTKAAHLIAILTLWHVRKERNARVFNEDRSMEQAVFTRIRDECSVWISAGGEYLATLGLLQIL